MKLLFPVLLTSICLLNACENSDFSRELFREIVTEEMQTFVDTLSFDELISILGLAQGKSIAPYSPLSMKFFLFFTVLEKRMPEFDDFTDEDDEEMSSLLYQLHTMAYERAWTLVEVTPSAGHYHTILLEQMHPEEYKQILKEQQAQIIQ